MGGWDTGGGGGGGGGTHSAQPYIGVAKKLKDYSTLSRVL